MKWNFAKSWQSFAIKRKIDKLTRKIFYSIPVQNEQALEYGNIRRSDEWGVFKEDTLQWIILVDVVVGKPVQYIIAYSFSDKKYSCFATSDTKNFSGIFQFSTSDIRELDFRLSELANHIPSLRERQLREYLFHESRNAPNRGWFKIFFKRGKIEDHLKGKIELLYNQGRISRNELSRLENYISNLI